MSGCAIAGFRCMLKKRIFFHKNPSGCPTDHGPLNIQLVLDSSASMGLIWAEMIKDLRENFIDVIMTNSRSKMAVTRFGSSAEQLV